MRLLFWLRSLLIAGLVCIRVPDTSQVRAQEADVPDKVDFLSEMRARAGQVSVATVKDGVAVGQPLQVTPLFRYSDPRRDILDAALWGFAEQGRPAALMKTEFYEINGRRHWVYCIATLSDNLIEAKWTDGARFDSSEPGLTMQSVPNGPPPGGTPAARLLQFKRLTKRFSARIQNGLDNRDQMRLMPTPICRYEGGQPGLIEGAVFGYTMGTNPDVLLVLELHRVMDGDNEWRCGAAGMTSAGFVVQMDDMEIMNQPFDPGNSGRPQAYARWMWHRVIMPPGTGASGSDDD